MSEPAIAPGIAPAPPPWRDVAIVLAAAALLGSPLLLGRRLANDDAYFHHLLAQQQAAHLRAGILWPAWAVEPNAGFGSPALVFYSPIPSYVNALPAVAGVPLLRAIGPIAVLVLAASGLAVLAWRRAAGDAAGGLAAALVYMAAPYRHLDLYQRAALGEHWTFVFPPLVLAALLGGGPRWRRIALAGLAASGLVLSNLPQAILLGLCLAAWAAFSQEARGPLRTGAELELGGPRVRGSRVHIEAVAAAVLAAGIGAVTLVPALYSRRWLATHLIDATTDRFSPSRNALFTPAAWPSFTFAVVATALVAGVAFLATAGRPGRRFWGLVAGIAFLSACPPVAKLWDVTPVLADLQFSWRIGGVVTLTAAALAARMASRPAWLLAVFAAVLSLPFVHGLGTVAASRVDRPAPAAARPGTRFPSPQAVHEAGGDVTGTGLWNPFLVEPYFRPHWVSPAMAPALGGGRVAGLATLHQRSAALVRHADAAVAPIRWGPHGGAVRIPPPEDDLLVFHQLWFPGMGATVDGVTVEAGREAGTGLLAVAVPAGVHDVAFAWKAPRPVQLARWTSVATLALTLALWLGSGRRW